MKNKNRKIQKQLSDEEFNKILEEHIAALNVSSNDKPRSSFRSKPPREPRSKSEPKPGSKPLVDAKSISDSTEQPRCYVCFEEFTTDRHLIRICANSKCRSNICRECATSMYSMPRDHKGKIERMKVLCGACGSLINPRRSCISPFVRYLFSNKIFLQKDDRPLSDSLIIAKMLQSGHRIWVCDSLICRNPDALTQIPCIFNAPKLACGEEFKEEEERKEHRICEKCTEYETTNDLTGWKKLGFVIDSGYPARKCPGPECDRIYEICQGTCPRMQCSSKTCLSHFCYCCGKLFVSKEEIYDHLHRDYGTEFPSLNQIRSYLITHDKVKSLRDWFDDDIPDWVIEDIAGNDSIETIIPIRPPLVPTLVPTFGQNLTKLNFPLPGDPYQANEQPREILAQTQANLPELFGERKIDDIIGVLKFWKEDFPELSNDDLQVMMIVHRATKEEDKKQTDDMVFDIEKWENDYKELQNHSTLSDEEIEQILMQQNNTYYRSITGTIGAGDSSNG